MTLFAQSCRSSVSAASADGAILGRRAPDRPEAPEIRPQARRALRRRNRTKVAEVLARRPARRRGSAARLRLPPRASSPAAHVPERLEAGRAVAARRALSRGDGRAERSSSASSRPTRSTAAGRTAESRRDARDPARAHASAEACLADGFRLGPAAPAHTAVVDGDTKSAAIAAASIVAKVTRDRPMRRMDALYPHYGFSSHVGYITPSALADGAAHAARRRSIAAPGGRGVMRSSTASTPGRGRLPPAKSCSAVGSTR